MEVSTRMKKNIYSRLKKNKFNWLNRGR